MRGKYADRIRVILLLDSGESSSDIARFLFLNESTVRNYEKRYKEGGLEKLGMRDKKEIKKINLPVLILQAEQDVVVSNELHKKFCETIPQNCDLKIFPGKHDLFIEKDKVRNQVIEATLTFFSENKKSK